MACTNTPPTLENCKGIIMGPYNLGYPLLNKHLEAAKIDPGKDRAHYNQKYS